MKRTHCRPAAVLALLVLTPIAPWALAQEAPKSQERLQSIIAEVESLKRTVHEQERRILQLERLVRQLSGRTKRPTRAIAVGFSAKENWHRVKEGMSTSQVINILGKPTRVKSGLAFRTLFYSGEVPGSGIVSGSVEFHDDQVWQVNIPFFQ